MRHARTLLSASLALGAALLALPASASPSPMTRQAILDLGKTVDGYSYWWGHGAWQPGGSSFGSCSGNCPSCTHSGSWGGDCSGFVAKAWQVPSPISVDKDGHPYSTVNFRNDTTHWSQISRNDVLPADAMVHNESGSGHIFLYEKGDGWGSMWAYECKGCSYGCTHDLRTATSNYVAIRREQIDDGPAPPPPLDATFVAQGSDQKADPSGAAQYQACAGAPVKFWFELSNTGSASWVDTNDTAAGNWGHAVRLGVPGDTPDPFTGTTRVSVNENANSDVHPPPGGDCNDKAGCRRTVFAKNGGIQGTAPAKPGMYVTKWRLVDEGRGWFGPDVWLSFDVVDCGSGQGGATGAGGAGVGAGGASGGGVGTGGAASGGKGGATGAGATGGVGAGAGAGGSDGTGGAAGMPPVLGDEGDEGDPPGVAVGFGASNVEQEAGCGIVASRTNDDKRAPAALALGVIALAAALRRRRAT